ncbi:hypothetical protein ROZALSC1DRAFT_29920 [Rozella allomycis CSF55]|uniref:BHLH domain-containing protein n=1 Tax=Rozella allomycis (strain CSF55) TaxID=988480 RepID=A0A4V1IZK6_ROZAC|nr:hypothetical protein ROZALSC1DRAFT_29920 [Rozella allomycis CSF55]
MKRSDIRKMRGTKFSNVEEKRVNHIASEQKRRLNIKLAYAELNSLLPESYSVHIDQANSEVNILSAVSAFIHDQHENQKKLLREINEKAGKLGKKY